MELSKVPSNALKAKNMQQGYRTRLEIVFAAKAAKAVILRRGPKRHFHLITWDMQTDAFTHGQWMKGIVRLCDLSPSGDKLIYWAAQYHASRPDPERGRIVWREDGERGDEGFAWEPAVPTIADAEAYRKRYPHRKLPRYMRPDPKTCRTARTHPPRRNEGVWTAISRPPYFTALAIWPAFGHWTGGGYFRSDNEVVLFESEDGMTPVENIRMPATFRVSAYSRTDPVCNIELDARNAAYDDVRQQLIAAHEALKLAGHYVDRLEPRADGTLILAVNGALYRVPGWRKLPPAELLDHSSKLADFNNLSFQLLPAPAKVMRWR